jgi:hypothetical protein
MALLAEVTPAPKMVTGREFETAPPVETVTGTVRNASVIASSDAG